MEKNLSSISNIDFKKGYIPILSELQLHIAKASDRLVLSKEGTLSTVLAIPVIVNNFIELGYTKYPSPKKSELLIRFRELRYNTKGFYVYRQTNNDIIYIDLDDIILMNGLNNNIIYKTIGGFNDK